MFTPITGNAIVSGIQIDSVDVPPPPTTTAQAQPPCEVIIGYGDGPLYDWPYVVPKCANMTGGPLRVTRVRCYADVAGSVGDLLAKNAAGQLVSLLVNPIACGPDGDGTEGQLLPSASYADGTMLRFAVRVVSTTPPPSASIVVMSAVVASGTAPTLTGLSQCVGSGPGWDCNGVWKASIRRADGTALSLVGADMQVAGGTWQSAK
jgi:hypothetical protein